MPVRQPYLQELEAESIHVLREAAAVFRNPVILYSIGKDSSVLLHLRTAEMSVEREIDAIIEAMRERGIID